MLLFRGFYLKNMKSRAFQIFFFFSKLKIKLIKNQKLNFSRPFHPSHNSKDVPIKPYSPDLHIVVGYFGYPSSRCREISKQILPNW